MNSTKKRPVGEFLVTVISRQVGVDETLQKEYFPIGSSITLTAASPNPGSAFKCWSGDVKGTDPTRSLKMDSDKNVIAEYLKLHTVKTDITAEITSTGFAQVGDKLATNFGLTLRNHSEHQVRIKVPLTRYLSHDGQTREQSRWTGIDIGAIKGVVQIGAPQTVASLCQRIGRAGRREDDVAVLWQYCIANTLGPGADCVDSLYPDLVQAVAVIQLFLAKWYEPPRVGALDYSTLIQQVLSLVGERHGTTAAAAYQMLCQTGPFNNVSEANFIAVLRAMAAKDLLMQDANKLLLHGTKGEKEVNHYTFYAAFPDSQEYRLRQGGKELGTLPLPGTSARDDVITFAGRRWRIEDINHEKRLVELVASGMGKPPRTGGNGLPVHRRVREEMRAVLAGSDSPAWLDATARSLLSDAQRQYKALQLADNRFVVEGHTVYLFVWEGDQLQEALAILLKSYGLAASNAGICIEVSHTTRELVVQRLAEISAQPCPAVDAIVQARDVRDPEKWDWVLPDDLFVASYASRALALSDAYALSKTLE